MGNSSELISALFQTMEIFSKAAVSKSDAAKTIECKILEIVDSEHGEYKVEYFGNKISVYSGEGTSYKKGEMVYVLVPEGDFSKNKIILGSTTGIRVAPRVISGEGGGGEPGSEVVITYNTENKTINVDNVTFEKE